MWIDPCQCLTAWLRKEAGSPPGAQRAGGDQLGAGHAKKGLGTAGPLGAGAPPGELQAGNVMLPWMQNSSALVWGASKAAVPRDHWLSKMVAVGNVNVQPLVWQWLGASRTSQAPGQGGEPAK